MDIDNNSVANIGSGIYKNVSLVLGDLGSIRGLSIRYLSSFTKGKGIKTKIIFPIIDNRGFNSLPRLTEIQKGMVLQFLNKHQATHFGCYLMTGHFRAFKELVLYLRKAGWQGCIIAGGVHPTVCPEESLFEGVDYAVMGPGEKPLIDIISNESNEKISGLIYQKNGNIIKNEIMSDAFIDLDLLPFPDYEHEDHFVIFSTTIQQMSESVFRKLSGWGGEYYYLTTTRGCPYRCSYCCNVNKHKLRRASVDRIIAELQYAKSKLPFLCGVNIQDDSFFMGSDEWVAEFCSKYGREFGWPFVARIMPRFCSEERLVMLKNAGLRYVSIGLQGSERMNSEIYNRKENNESFLKACRLMEKVNIIFVVDVILDVVYETEEDLREVARTLNQLSRPFKVLAYSMTPFPGTDFYDRVVKDGLLNDFAADAYESMFIATRPNAYKTPLYWRRLIKNVIPLYKNKEIDVLIESGADDKSSELVVNRIYRRAVLRMKLAEWMRQRFPRYFTRAVSFYTYFNRKLSGQQSPRSLRLNFRKNSK
jgi:anaerobic magnesium-protoporphyrin IX monomethyl ester cyclase